MESGIVERARFVSSDIGDGDDQDIESALSMLQGVRDVEVDPSGHAVQVTYDPTVVDVNLVRETLESDGYKIDSANE